jgi:small-conductance mechanosensitive channel
MNKLVVIRIIIGAFFVFSGFEKLVGPVENFQAVIESYEVLNHNLSVIAALIMPWIELFAGVFVFLGLWLKVSLSVLGSMTIMFIGVVGQAIVRDLPIDECGCFGEALSLPLPAVIVMDSIICTLIVILIKNLTETSAFSLDNYFLKKSQI